MVLMAQNLDRAIAKRITQAREEAGLSKSEFAERIGMSKQGYTPYERGDHEFTVKELAKMSRVLGHTVEWLLGIGEQEPDEQRVLSAYRAIGSPRLRELAIEQLNAIAGVIGNPEPDQVVVTPGNGGSRGSDE